MSELLVQDTSVIATADAIREKIGTSAKLNWVANKGFADVIQSIIVNSTLPSGVTAISTGSFVPVQNLNTSSWVVHNLGRTPNFVMVFMEDEFAGHQNVALYKNCAICGMLIRMAYAVAYTDMSFTYDGFIVSVYGASDGKGLDQNISRVYDTAEYFSSASNSFNIKINTADFKEGVTYRWVAAYIEGI